MSPSIRPWSVLTERAELDFGFSFALAAVRPSAGPLRYVDNPVLVSSAGPTLIMLSASAGVRPPGIDAVLASAVDQLLSVAFQNRSSGVCALAKIRQRLWELFGTGAFYGSTPNGCVLTVIAEDKLAGVSFGPVGAAKVKNAQVSMLHSDDRLPKLVDSGALSQSYLSHPVLGNPLVNWVSSLTFLEPKGPGELCCSGGDGYDSVMLMSRGAFPFVLPESETGLKEWAALEAGWMHGMGACVVQVFRGECPLSGIAFRP